MEALREEIAVVEEKFSLLDASVKALNGALRRNNAVEIEKARVEAKEALDVYNEFLIDKSLVEFAGMEKPFLAALADPYIVQYRIKSEKDKEAGTEFVSVEQGNPAIVNLRKLEGKCVTGMFCVNGQWPYWVEKFTMLLNARATADVGADTARFKNLYRISKTANESEIGATPTSNTQITNQLQKIVNAIIFEAVRDKEGKPVLDKKGNEQNLYKVTSADVRFILYVMIREGRKNSIVCCKAKTMEKLITKVLHRIVTDGNYESEYAETKA